MENGEVISILRAKNKNQKSYLLKDHLREVIEKASELEDYISKNKSNIGYDFDEEFFESLIIACFLHDLGKINWEFQLKVFDKKEKNKENGKYKNEELNLLYKFFEKARDIKIEDHEIISVLYSLLFIENSEWDKKIRTAIILHHYNNFYINKQQNVVDILEEYPDVVKYIDFLISRADSIKKNLELLLDELAEKIKYQKTKAILKKLKEKINFEKIRKFKENLEKKYDRTEIFRTFVLGENDSQELYEFFLFLGFLRRCDYAASGEVVIEKVKEIEREVYINLEQNIKRSIKKEGEIWQEKIINNHNYGKMILVAPTGSGKTEFALIWAKKRKKKLLYTLPLRAALNDLYFRFLKKEKEYFQEAHLGILHSTSFLEYLKEEEFSGQIKIEDKINSSYLFSYPVLLTTPDQILVSSLKYYGFDKIISIYPLSCIVIDEIQAYKPEMAAVIIKTLEIVQQLKGDILIITATFPPYFIKYFKDNFNILNLEELIKEGKINKKEIKNYELKRHKIETIKLPLFIYKGKEEIDEKSFKKIEEIISQNSNKKIMIILNNVEKAKNLYKKLSSQYFEQVELLHGRLIEKEKEEIINKIKTKIENNENIILIATQIIEASVDIDFDILITEISPIDSQVQRWGRIWRNRNTDYREKSPNIYIFIGSSQEDIDKDRGTNAIYDNFAIKKTVEVLEKNKDKNLGYEEEKILIEEVYSDELLRYYENEIDKNLEWLEYYSCQKRKEAQKIFRNIEGIRLVDLEKMKKSRDKIERIFAEILEDEKNYNLPLEDTQNSIAEKIKKELKDEKERQKVNKWKLLKILYLYSFSAPFFSIKKVTLAGKKEFRGFIILKEGEEEDRQKSENEYEEYIL
ncbi:MAG: CRISPR-associated helicase Cas3' [Candidatus Anstonellaceae archaeon]